MLTQRRGIEFQWNCLEFDEFLIGLVAVQSMGREGQLDVHYRPQHLGCGAVKVPVNTTLIRGDISTVNAALEHVGDLFPNRFQARHEHNTTQHSVGMAARSWDMMCALTRPEYEALKLELPLECGE